MCNARVLVECTSPTDLTGHCMHREEYMQLALSWLLALSPLVITTQAAYSGRCGHPTHLPFLSAGRAQSTVFIDHKTEN